MNWIFVGLLLSSTVTSFHDTREACEGRKLVLGEKGVIGRCVEFDKYITNGLSIGTLTVPYGTVTVPYNLR